MAFSRAAAKAATQSGYGGAPMSADSFGFNRKSFAWGPKTKPNAETPDIAQQPSRGQGVKALGQNHPREVPHHASNTEEDAVLLHSAKVYAVLEKCHVREQPDIDAKKLSTKSKGARFSASQTTMDGWLKLSTERGWVLADMRGLDSLGKIVVPVDSFDLAVPGYHAQGISCLEVKFVRVAVRQSPSTAAAIVTYRYKQEFVYARAQSFDGWVKLVGEPGWMLVHSEEFGQLLQPCYDRATCHADLQALSDVWLATRKMRCPEDLLPNDIALLKQLEASALQNAYDAYSLLEAGSSDEIVREGLLEEQELDLPSPWILRRLFGTSLERILMAEPVFDETLQHFTRSPPLVKPLPVLEDSIPENANAGLEIEVDGRVYVAGVGGLMVDKETQQLVGFLNPETQQIEDLPDEFDASAGVVMVENEGRTYLMNSAGILLDPACREIAGVWNQDTQSIDAVGGSIRLSKPNASNDEDNDDDVMKYVQKGQELFKKRRFHTAAFELDKALQVCESQRFLDMEVECEVLKARARCWQELKNHEKLAADAERLLGIDDGHPEALEWKRIAAEALTAPCPGNRRIGGS